MRNRTVKNEICLMIGNKNKTLTAMNKEITCPLRNTKEVVTMRVLIILFQNHFKNMQF